MAKDMNAIDIVRQMVTDGQVSQEVAERYFPELKESEDEKIRKGLIEYFKDFRLGTFAYLEPKKIIAWLEKQGEQKYWSEVDNFMYNKIKNLLTDISLAPEAIKSLFDWLKDLRDRVQPQTTWKPSDEQIEALKEATNIVGSKYKSCLASLYQELKKLREE